MRPMHHSLSRPRSCSPSHRSSLPRCSSAQRAGHVGPRDPLAAYDRSTRRSRTPPPARYSRLAPGHTADERSRHVQLRSQWGSSAAYDHSTAQLRTRSPSPHSGCPRRPSAQRTGHVQPTGQRDPLAAYDCSTRPSRTPLPTRYSRLPPRHPTDERSRCMQLRGQWGPSAAYDHSTGRSRTRSPFPHPGWPRRPSAERTGHVDPRDPPAAYDRSTRRSRTPSLAHSSRLPPCHPTDERSRHVQLTGQCGPSAAYDHSTGRSRTRSPSRRSVWPRRPIAQRAGHVQITGQRDPLAAYERSTRRSRTRSPSRHSQSSDVKDAGNMQPRGPWVPLAAYSNSAGRSKSHPPTREFITRQPKLTERQKRNKKIFPRLRNPYFTTVVDSTTKPYVLQLNINPSKPYIIQSSKYASKQLIVTNNNGSKTLFLVQFHPLQSTNSHDQDLVDKLAQLIADLFMMAKNRQDIKPTTMESGKMQGIGFRGASDNGATAGTYARKRDLPEDIIEEDNRRWDKLRDYNQFLCSRVKNFLFQSFEDNADIIKQFGIPSWSHDEWNDFADECNRIFSSAIVTHSNFSNNKHMDDDLNPWSYGLFSYVDPSTGVPLVPNSKDMVPGHCLHFPDFKCNLDFGTSPGIIEVLWSSNSVNHQTRFPPPPLQSTQYMTHFGSSLQISHRLMQRAIALQKLSTEEREKATLCRQKRAEMEVDRRIEAEMEVQKAKKKKK